MKHTSRFWLWLLLCGISFTAAATAIHTWVDANGVTHFSDAPPSDATVEVTAFEMADDFPPASDPEADYYSIANQWKRVREEREAKAKLALEEARVRASESATTAYAESPPEDAAYPGYPVYTRGYPLYAPRYGYGYGRPGLSYGYRGGFGPGAHHATARGGHGTGDTWRSPGVSRSTVGPRTGRKAAYRGANRSTYRGGTGFSFGFGLR